MQQLLTHISSIRVRTNVRGMNHNDFSPGIQNDPGAFMSKILNILKCEKVPIRTTNYYTNYRNASIENTHNFATRFSRPSINNQKGEPVIDIGLHDTRNKEKLSDFLIDDSISDFKVNSFNYSRKVSIIEIPYCNLFVFNIKQINKLL